MIKWLDRSAAVLLSPRVAFRRVLYGREGGIGDILLLMLWVLVGTAPAEITTVLMGSDRGAATVLIKLAGMYLNFSLTPFLVCVALALLLSGLERMRGRRLALETMVAACTYLWVPVAVLGLLGSMLRVFGLDLSVLPQVPLTFFLGAGPSWWMVLLRVVLSYGWSIYLAWILLLVVRGGETTELAPAPLPARSILGGWILLSYVVGGVFVAVHYDQIRPVQVGDRARDFALARADGKGMLSLASLSGHPVVVEFWATWCPNCVAYMGELDGWARAHPKVAVLAVHRGDSVQDLQQFLSGKNWPHLVFLADESEQVSNAYRVDTLPALFIVTKDGAVAATRLGAPPAGWLERYAVP